MNIIKKPKTILIIFLILLFLIWLFIKYTSSPSVGKINSHPANQPTIAPIDIFTFEGQYFTFKYNSNYELRPNEIKEATLVDQVTLWGKNGLPNQIIGYREISTTDINEVSAVQMRRIKKDEYLEEKTTLDGIPALFFKKVPGIEFVTLAIKDNKLLSISLAANSNDEEKYTIEYKRTLDSFKWR